MKLIVITSFTFAVICSPVYSQQSDWKVFNTFNSHLPDNQIQSVYIDENNVKWLGTSSGLVKYDGVQWITFNKSNTVLPSNYVTSIAGDGAGGIWIGTDAGLAHLDGSRWNVYTTQNSPLTSNSIQQVKYDANAVWFCTDKGLLKYFNNTWTVYDQNTSGLAVDFIYSIAVDLNGTVWLGAFDNFSFNGYIWTYNGAGWKYFRLKDYGLYSSFPVALACDPLNQIWIGTKGTGGGALVKVSGGDWTVYDKNKSGFPGGGINSILIEGSNKWIATGSGLISFNEGEWKILNQKNSNLPDDYVHDVVVDKYGNKWIATISGGLAVYKPGGIISSIEEQQSITDNLKLFENYPNPFNPVTIIRYTIPHASVVNITVYDALGRKTEELVNEEKQAGTYEVKFDASRLASGIYFYRLQTNGFTASKKMLMVK